MSNKRKDILRSLLITEEDTLERFEELVKKSTSLFKINGKNGAIIFEVPTLSNPEKISLLLIGKYFAHELSIVDTFKKSSGEIAKELLIKTTTLSGPLRQLVSSNYLSQENSLYFINHYKINEILDSLITKYQDYNKDVKIGLALKSGRSDKKKTVKDTPGKNGKIKIANKDESIPIAPSIKYTMNPNGIADLAGDLGTSEDKIKQLFEFEENQIHLLKKIHNDKDSQESFNNSIIYLTVFYYHLNQREIKVDELIKTLNDAGVPIGTNFKRDMKNSKRRPFILHKVDSYKITEEGIKLGLRLLKEIIG